MDRFQGLLGLGVLLGIAYMISNNKKRINWKTIGVGVGPSVPAGYYPPKNRPGFACIPLADRQG